MSRAKADAEDGRTRLTSGGKVSIEKRIAMSMVCGAVICSVQGNSIASTFWEEDFEGATVADLGPYACSYDCSVPGTNPGTSTDFAFHGSRSLKEVFTVDQSNYSGAYSGGYFDRTYPATDEVWTRFYYRTTNFSYDGVGTKDILLGTDSYYPSFWSGNFNGSREMTIGAQVPVEDCGVGPYDSCHYTQNMAHVSMEDDRWYCIESHLKMNTPGVADAVIEMWVDDLSDDAPTQQTIGYYNRTLRGTEVQGTNGNSSLATFSLVRFYAFSIRGSAARCTPSSQIGRNFRRKLIPIALLAIAARSIGSQHSHGDRSSRRVSVGGERRRLSCVW